MKKKIKKIESDTIKWRKLANELARSWVQIKPCCDCGYPVIDGYCCSFCGSNLP